MEDKPRRLKALGRAATLGTLYNACADEIINVSLFKKELPDKLVNTIDTDNVYYELTMNDSYEEKFNKLQIDAELKLSLMAGMFKLEGSGKYLSDEKTSYKSAKSSIIYELKTKKENIHLSNQDLKEYLSHSSLDIDNATHVICGIQWGANSYCSFEYENKEHEDKKLVEGNLNACLNKIALQISGNASVNYTENEKVLLNNLHIKFVGDIVPKDKELPQTYQKVLEYIRDIPSYLKEVNNGKGIQLEYELIPLSFVQKLFSLEIAIDRLVVSIEKSFIKNVEIEMDNFLKAKQKFNDLKQDIEQNKVYFSSKDLSILLSKDSEIKLKEIEFKESLANKLIEIRSGKSNISEIKDLLDEFLNSNCSPNDLELFLNNHEYMKNKLDDIKILKNYGIEHLKKNTLPRNIVLQNKDKKVYILFYTTDLKIENDDDWKNNFEFLKKLTRENKSGSNSLFYMCDVELYSKNSELKGNDKKIAIHYYSNDKLINEDYYLSEKERLKLAFAKSDKIESFSKSKYSCLLNLKCPLWNKSDGCSDEELNWKCPKCNGNYEYGYDDKLYCNCGGAKYDTFLFKCSNPHHPDDYVSYPRNEIKNKLDEIKKNRKEYNILLLGETGVGKSTLINGLINYLHYENLDDAIKGELQCVIPSKFTFMSHEISGGKLDKNENTENNGESATQFSKAHVFTFGNNLVRLIDTPGIGDTRGLDNDKTNIDNILKYISNYDHLNGICILLKPNSSRLTVALRYCIKELLTHLHKEARNNILFLYTNSRSTFYQPGDTDVPLRTLLSDIEKDSKIKIPYNSNNTFCYDNEAFRLLCIIKDINKFTEEQKIQIMDSKKDYKISWEKSVNTTVKLLNYVGDLKTHSVKETISLNEAKRLITSLSKPIAEITRTIVTNENLINDQIKQIQNLDCVQDLEKFLYLEKIVLEAQQLGYPRTVCTSANCVKYFKFDDKTDIDYITHCHTRCYLQGVSTGTVNTPEIQKCSAMDNNGKCQNCGCLWNVHMHITYECKQVKKKVVDESTKKKIDETNNKKKQQQILIDEKRNLIKEYENEKSILIQTSAEIANFVKLNSICVFNDDFGNYLDLLINEETGKLSLDSKRNKILSGMQDLKREYEEQKKIITEALKNPATKVLTVDDVQTKINNLYKLKHFGENLKEVMKIADNSRKTVFEFKEDEHNIPPKKQKGKKWFLF